MESTDHTHYCRDCELELALLYDDRDDDRTSIVCGHCGGTNTHELHFNHGDDESEADERARRDEFDRAQNEMRSAFSDRL